MLHFTQRFLQAIVSEKHNMDKDLEKKLFESRVIIVGGYIDSDVAGYVVLRLLQMSAESDTDEIQMFIGSVSGNYLDVLAIYDTMRSLSNPISGTGIGAVGNYAAILLAGCNKGSRCCLCHCKFSLEQPYGSLKTGSNQQTEIAIAASEVRLERETMESLLALHTGKSVDDIHNDLEFGIELNAEQAKEYGLIDYIIGSPNEE